MIMQMNTTTAPRQWHIKRLPLETVQINLGNRCNQQCAHCHVGGGPDGTSMDRHTALMILEKLAELSVRSIEFTGGAPKLNPHFPFFIEKLAGQKKHITVHNNRPFLHFQNMSNFSISIKKHKV
jgi:MoaA/NifB/PqqE/SkfB family radical SAM enzyme